MTTVEMHAGDESLATAALDLVENMIIITDRDGSIEYVNPAFCTVTGYEASDAIGANPRLLRSGVQDDAFYKDLWDRILAGKTWTGELVNRRRNGELYTDRMTITPLRNGVGDISHFVAVKRDVSSHLAALTAGNPSGIAHTDATGRLVYANDRLCNLLKTPFEELLGRGWLEALGTAAARQIGDALQRDISRSGVTLVIELADRRNLRVRFAPLVLGPEGQAGLVVTFEDVTSEREMLRRSRDREAFARSILESLGTPTAVVDASGTIRHVNRAWREIAQTSRADPHRSGVGADYRAVCQRSIERGCDAAQPALAALDRVLDGTSEMETIDYELAGTPSSWWELRITPLEIDDGGAVLTHTDITWRRDLQHQLERQAETDALTGLPNRVGLLKFGAEAMARARRTGHPVTVMFADLDRFKPINDMYGHEAGDNVLQICAQRMQKVVRETDCVARVGGDEFVIVCEALPDSDTEQLQRRIVEAVIAPIDVGEPVSVGVSVGTVRAPGDADFAQVIADADERMYAAKQSKPNKHARSSPETPP